MSIFGYKKRKKRYKKPQVNHVDAQSMLGAIVDMPIEKFKEELIEQKTNIGTINNLILHLEMTYNDMRQRKDAVLKLVFEGKNSKDDPDIQKSLKGLYAEMTKIEQKITWLKDRSKELVNVDETPN